MPLQARYCYAFVHHLLILSNEVFGWWQSIILVGFCNLYIRTL